MRFLSGTDAVTCGVGTGWHAGPMAPTATSPGGWGLTILAAVAVLLIGALALALRRSPGTGRGGRTPDRDSLSVPVTTVRDMSVQSSDVTPADVTPSGERPRRRLALSPSRAGDFKNCPLLYRYRAIDRLPEPTGRAAARGILVHLVLQRLFARPADQRGLTGTLADVVPAWTQLVEQDAALNELVPPTALAAWIADAQRLLRRYYELEDPRRLEPEACEWMVEAELVGGGPADGPTTVPVRGILDRLDRGPDGRLRVVDYKTGRAPGPEHELGALSQLKFYALMVWRSRGEVPGELRLIYLDDGLTLRYSPTADELAAYERGLGALWRTVSHAVETGDFPARRGAGCRWCVQQDHCPEFGGQLLPYPGFTRAPSAGPVNADAPH